jgi:uncharacterized membrane protein
VKLSYLWHGLPGHPIHPPLTDATIGAYTFATIAAIIQVLGITAHNGAIAWWLALLVGAIWSSVTVVTGFVDWLTITPGTPLKRTATSHALVNAGASVFFVLAIIVGHKHYSHGLVGTWPFIFTIVGWLLLTVGGWLGGAVTFVHGMRVLNLVEEPARRAAAPVATPEKEMAEGA